MVRAFDRGRMVIRNNCSYLYFGKALRIFSEMRCNDASFTLPLSVSRAKRTVSEYVDSAGRVKRFRPFFVLFPDYSNSQISMEVNGFSSRGKKYIRSSRREPVGQRNRGDQGQLVRCCREHSRFDRISRV